MSSSLESRIEEMSLDPNKPSQPVGPTSVLTSVPAARAPQDHVLPQILAVSSVSKDLAAQWIARAREHALVFAVGPSGVGKSVLMHQVVVPALRQSDHQNGTITPFMPGDDPRGFFQSLWNALGGGTGELMPSDPHQSVLAQLKASQAHGRPILIIDGLDQIFARTEEEAAQAIQFLWEISQSGLAVVLAALRCPFRDKVARLLPKEALETKEVFVEVNLPDAQARRVLAWDGLRMVTPELEQSAPSVFQRVTDQIAQQLTQAPHALPFLNPLLESWKDHVACGDTSVMNWLRAGGIAGLVASHAETKFIALKPRLRRQLENVIEALVTWDDDLSPIVMEVPYSHIQALGADASELVNVLIYERVLHVTGEDTDNAMVALSHPDLISHWKRASKVVEEMRRDRNARRLMDAQAVHWDSNGRRSEDRWLEGDLVIIAETLLRSDTSSLPPLTQEFLKTFDSEPTQAKPKIGRLKRLVKPLALVLVVFAMARMVRVDAGGGAANKTAPASPILTNTSRVFIEDEEPPPVEEATVSSSGYYRSASVTGFLRH